MDPTIDLTNSDEATTANSAVDKPTTAHNAPKASAPVVEDATTSLTMLRQPRGHPLNPTVPKTIANLWNKVEQLYDQNALDTVTCTSRNCPFTHGPLMQQRYNLMSRLVVLEKWLYLGTDSQEKGDIQ